MIINALMIAVLIRKCKTYFHQFCLVCRRDISILIGQRCQHLGNIVDRGKHFPGEEQTVPYFNLLDALVLLPRGDAAVESTATGLLSIHRVAVKFPSCLHHLHMEVLFHS